MALDCRKPPMSFQVFGGAGSNHSPGLVPDPGTVVAGGRFLRDDSSWSNTITTPTMSPNSQFEIKSSDGGVFSALAFTQNNISIGFDVDYVNNTFIARNATVAWVYKLNGNLLLVGSGGNTVGTHAGQNIYTTLNLTNGAFGVGNNNPQALLHVTYDTAFLTAGEPAVLIEGNTSSSGPSPQIGFIDLATGSLTTAPMWCVDNDADTFRVFRKPNVSTGATVYASLTNSGGFTSYSGRFDGNSTPVALSNSTGVEIGNSGSLNFIQTAVRPSFGYGTQDLWTLVGGAFHVTTDAIGAATTNGLHIGSGATAGFTEIIAQNTGVGQSNAGAAIFNCIDGQGRLSVQAQGNIDGTALTTGTAALLVRNYSGGFSISCAGGIISGSGSMIACGVDNTGTCGGASNRFTAVYAVNGTIQTSDIRYKVDVAPTDLGSAFVLGLEVFSYREKDDPPEVRRRGVSAQQVLLLLGDRPATGIVDFDAKADRYGLNYAGLVPALITTVQTQQRHIEMLEARLSALEGVVNRGGLRDA